LGVEQKTVYQPAKWADMVKVRRLADREGFHDRPLITRLDLPHPFRRLLAVELDDVRRKFRNDLVKKLVRRIDHHRDSLHRPGDIDLEFPGARGGHIARALCEEDESDMARTGINRGANGFRRRQAANLDIEGHTPLTA